MINIKHVLCWRNVIRVQNEQLKSVCIYEWKKIYKMQLRHYLITLLRAALLYLEV